MKQLVSEIHPKASTMPHRDMDGQIDLMSARWEESKLQPAQGEPVFPLEKQEANTEPIEEGATVTVELNEAGSVISLHRADSAAPKHYGRESKPVITAGVDDRLYNSPDRNGAPAFRSESASDKTLN